jgi:hypothetical protein
MNLYLDDDTASPLLARLLTQAGHDVQRPIDAGTAGRPDPFHLIHTITAARVLMTGNQDDFELLHDLVLRAGGHHPGILVICRDNNPKRDLTPRGVVVASRNLEASGISLRDQFVILNHWR